VRTTLTIDDDVAAKVRAEMHRSKRSFKETINDILRRGLNSRTPRPPLGRFVVRARPLGQRPGLNYDKVGELLDQIEGPLSR
jgi:hypothetical protein